MGTTARQILKALALALAAGLGVFTTATQGGAELWLAIVAGAEAFLAAFGGSAFLSTPRDAGRPRPPHVSGRGPGGRGLSSVDQRSGDALSDREPPDLRLRVPVASAIAITLLMSGCATGGVRKIRTAKGFCYASPEIASRLPDVANRVCSDRKREQECRQAFAAAALGVGQAGGYACEASAGDQ